MSLQSFTSEDLQEFDYDSSNTVASFFLEIKELWLYRDLIILLTKQSVFARYKRSVFGVLWTLLNPLLLTAVYAFAFSTIFQMRGANYPVFLLSGILAWQFLQQTVTVSMKKLVWGSNLMKRVYMPSTTFSLSVLGDGVINLMFSLVALFIIMIIVGHPFSFSLIFVPISLLILSIFTLGLSLMLSVFAVYFTDLTEMVSPLFRAWFYASAVIFPPELIPEQYQWVLDYNPMFHMVRLFRTPIYDGQVPELSHIVPTLLFSIFILLVGWYLFTRKAKDFAYRI